MSILSMASSPIIMCFLLLLPDPHHGTQFQPPCSDQNLHFISSHQSRYFSFQAYLDTCCFQHSPALFTDDSFPFTFQISANEPPSSGSLHHHPSQSLSPLPCLHPATPFVSSIGIIHLLIQLLIDHWPSLHKRP